MKIAIAALAFVVSVGEVEAQDLVITNARIVDGTGRVIERGSIEISGGRIRAVGEAPAGSAEGAVMLDAEGRTVLPGLIEAHRHDLLGSLQAFSTLESDAAVAAAIERETPERLATLLREGFTTVMMPGVYLNAGLEVRRRLARGEIEGPRLLFTGPGFAAPDDFPVRGMVCGENAYCAERVAFQVTDPSTARGHVRELAAAGVDGIKIFVDNAGNELDEADFEAIVEEAEAHDLPVMLHAHWVDGMLAGVESGADRLVHTPGDRALADGPTARLLRDRNVAIATTASFTSPQFAQALGFEYSAAERHELILQNIRYLVDEGVTVAFGSDSPDRLRPIVEIEELARVLSPAEILATLTRDAAAFVNLSDEIGTLEAGKVADILMVDGDPLADVTDLARVAVVIQGGRVVVDNRAARGPYVRVLGTAQDGGLPHAGCSGPRCERARRDPTFARRVASLAIVVPRERAPHAVYLVDASPDLPAQLTAVSDLRGEPSGRVDRAPVDGVLLTHAHVGHYLGLAYFGLEAISTHQLPVWCTPRMAEYLRANGPWSQLVTRSNVDLHAIEPGGGFVLEGGVRVVVEPVPHRDEYADTAGFRLIGPNRTLLYVPDTDAWAAWQPTLEDRLQGVDVAIVDGTFYSPDELPGRDLSQIPHPLITDTIQRLAPAVAAGELEVYFTHMNHSNPALEPESAPRRAIEAAGFGVLADGQEIDL
jgi:pyrroloquinoline quinone biosynthesis protein B